MKHYFFVLILAVAVALGFGPAVHGQEEDNYYFTYGVVADISETALVLTEFDYIEEKEFNETYLIDSDTELEGVSSISEITLGEEIEIMYAEEEEGKVVRVLTRIESFEDEQAYQELGLGINFTKGVNQNEAQK